MKRKLDLRTGRTVWSAYRAPAVPAGTLTRDVKTDILVVGMGISGAMIAEALTADGHSVIAIDRRGPIKGSTPATTALVQFEIDQPLSVLSKKIGREKAVRGWQRSRLAMASLAARIEDLGIRCDAHERRSLYLAGNVLDPAGLRQEAEARRAAGIASIYLTPAKLSERFGIDRRGALLSYGNLALDPRKLTAGLLLKAAERGARFYAPVEAVDFAPSKDEIVVHTRGGPSIRAGAVVLATGFELAEKVPAAHHQIISTYAIATRPQPGKIAADMPMIWEASDPYLYLRTTPDGRIICGGEDEDFTDEDVRDGLLREKTEKIAEKLKKLLPAIDPTPEFAWAGSFGTTSTGLPIIGSLPRHPRMFAVLGYGGNGITWSQIASEIVRTALQGGRDADADLFSFG